MSDGQNMERRVFTLPKKVISLLEDMSKSFGQDKNKVLKVSILFLHFVLGKVSQGYEIQLKHRETGEVVTLPIGI